MKYQCTIPGFISLVVHSSGSAKKPVPCTSTSQAPTALVVEAGVVEYRITVKSGSRQEAAGVAVAEERTTLPFYNHRYAKT